MNLYHRSQRIACMSLLVALQVAGMATAGQLRASAPKTAARKPAEGELELFLGEPKFEIEQIFTGERFPNVVVTTDGAIVATWGRNSYRVRRSEDGGETWGPEITVAEPGIHGGGALVDERSGNVFVFVNKQHPPAPLTVFRSTDHGRTFSEEDVVIHPDENGNVPAMHMSERGTTLRHGPKAGRLLRPARVYGGRGGYNTAIYSDDGGATWRPSAPFPALGTGEGAVAELSDGRVYYNSRRHRAPEGVNARSRWTAYSRDAGETWEDLSVSDVLPDGAQNRDYGLMGGLARLPVRGRDILVFSNIVSPEGRRNGHVWASFDGGKTWPLKRLVDEDIFGYSSLAAGRPETPSEGRIYLLYEGPSGGRIARFNLAWLLEGEKTGDGEVPELETVIPGSD